MSTVSPATPSSVLWIVRTLEKAGYETWAVGGAVRDALAGRPARHDDEWDLATRARPGEVRKVFRRTVPIGVDHGTVGVLDDGGTMYDVTTFRRDVETDGRHAVISFADTIQEDLARRDFTINAVAWHPLREELLDPYDGLGDLRRRVLRTVGEPEERFREDYLRILRALRFAGLFQLEVEGATWTSLSSLVDHLTTLSAERVREELMKVLDQDADPTRALDLYARSGALRVLYPELDGLRGSGSDDRRASGDREREAPGAWTLSLAAVAALPRGRPLLRLAALVRELSAREVAAMLVRLRLSNVDTEETARRAGADPLPPAEVGARAQRRWLSAVGPERLTALARLDLARAEARCRLGMDDTVESVVEAWKALRTIRRSAPPLAVGDLELDGRDLIAMGLKPGPRFGEILDALLDWVLDDPERNRKELLADRALELSREVMANG